MSKQAHKYVAHFLLNSFLQTSPPNDAMSRVYTQHGFKVDMFAPENHAKSETLQEAHYGVRWIVANVFKRKWRKYSAFSCTTEEPVAVAAILAVIWRKPLIVLSDEIRAGAYYGTRPEYWKKLCRWGLRRANLTIVNDEVRVALQQRYAGLNKNHDFVVYPGCFLEPPKPVPRSEIKKQWGIKENEYILGFSGYFDLTTGIDLALGCLDEHKNVKLMAQPLGSGELTNYLIKNHRHHDRLCIQETRMTWYESWASAGGMDVGVAFYRNQGDQFQLMGISSNRLCMFLAMGIPVIVNKQPSFQFIEDYECGFMVETQEEFNQALGKILNNLEQMKANAVRCSAEYIDTQGRLIKLSDKMAKALGVPKYI